MTVTRIRGHVEVHAETHWEPRADGRELVVDAFRVEHRDGSVEFVMTPHDALTKIRAHHERSRRAAERKDPQAKVMWITTIEWHVPDGVEVPTLEVRS